MKIYIFLLCVSLSGIANAITPLSYNDLIEEGESELETPFAQGLIIGYGDGVEWSLAFSALYLQSAGVAIEGGQLFSCPPQDLVIRGKDYLPILQSFLLTHPEYKSQPLGKAMFHAMMDRFPCGK